MASLPVVGQIPRVPVGRLKRYSLRVSVLEQCPLSCVYCAPGSVTSATEKARWLDAPAYVRLAKLFRQRGVVKVHITGGEPLVRPDVVDVVGAFKEAMPDADLAITTNAQRLRPLMEPLARAGLGRVTIHLDTLRDERYTSLMGADAGGCGDASDIVSVAVEAKARFERVKLNVVVQRGKNDDELHEFLALSRRTGIEVRFIELMSTGSADDYVKSTFIAGREIVERIGAVPVPRRHSSDPAALYRAGGGDGDGGVVFGVIASDTEPFCSDCDRLRLTADGRLRGCLYQSDGVPVGAALKSGASDETLGALIDTGLDDKRSWHPLVAPHRVPFSMADVGG